jgi:tetratricopeptide (TPR) repeat protein
VSDRLLVDLGADGNVSVGTWPEDGLPELAAQLRLAWPLDEAAVEDLRWYLENYLRAPFGVYEERGPQVAARLAGWGKAVFMAVFGSGPARDAYVRARARSDQVEVVFRSSSPGLLSLPWELMWDPARPVPLALEVAGMSRSVPVAGQAETVGIPGGRLRALIVISRPAGTGDVAYRMIARPLLDRLQAVRGEVDLVVLRPATLEAFAKTLEEAAAAGQPFHVVHFDGHGALPGRRAAGPGAPLAYLGPDPEGVLAFEKRDGRNDEVTASKVAQVLRAGKVPVVVLNACQSGAVGKELEATVAIRLLQEGIASVVAMAYSVYAVAAAEFMGAFYERLFAGGTISAAVTDGRRRLRQHDQRPSPKGDMPLQDWLIPVHYMRRDVSFPYLRKRRGDGRNSDKLPGPFPQITAAEGEASLKAIGRFVGRDGLFYQLEAAVRLQNVVLLHGPAGTGKTELAMAFGRWWRDTGGTGKPEWVFWHSFGPEATSSSLDEISTVIGQRVHGSDFASRDRGERRAVISDLLARQRMLLIWDNFETVRSMPRPDGAARPLDEEGWEDLRAFLARLADHGHSAVIITSRTREDWLGNIRRIQVGALLPEEAAEYAGELLAPYPAAKPRRDKRAFGELMEWLDGHPFSMRLILPHLDTTEPQGLLDALRGTAALARDDNGDGTLTSLAASIAYSYTHLAWATRRLLPAVCLLEGVADVAVLAAFSGSPWLPERFRSATLEQWHAALADAARYGLLTPLDADTYRIHPALPMYLADLWSAEEPADHDSVRDAATMALAIAHASLGIWFSFQIESGDAGLAYKMISLQRRTLTGMLDYALKHRLWEIAERIAAPLDHYWVTRGLDDEADAWADRALTELVDVNGRPPELSRPAGSLWLFFANARATRQLKRLHLDDAERSCRQILTMLEAEPSSSEQQRRLATTMHHLGIAAEQRGRLSEAVDWYRKALPIRESLGDQHGMATSYAHLGNVACLRGQFADAADWYRQGLAIFKDLGDREGIADVYHQLSIAARGMGDLGDAQDWDRKALAMYEDLGDRRNMAKCYHHLGIVAYLRQQLAGSENLYLQALTIFENLDDQHGMAVSYHQLGMIAEHRERPQDAENWYRKALAIETGLGNKPGMAITSGQLGLLALTRQQRREALEWMVRSVTLLDDFSHPGAELHNLALLTTQLGTAAVETCWHEVTGSPLPPAVRDYISSFRAGEGE